MAYPTAQTPPRKRKQQLALPQMPKKRILRMEVCKFWVAGRCSRRPCPFLHGEPPQKLPNGPSQATEACKFWLAGLCSRHPCPYLHSEPLRTLPKRSDPSGSCSNDPGDNRGIQRSSSVWRNPNSNPRTNPPLKQCKIGDEVNGGASKITKVATSKPPDDSQKVQIKTVNEVHGGAVEMALIAASEQMDDSQEVQCKTVDEIHAGAVKMALIATSVPLDESQELQCKIVDKVHGRAVEMALIATNEPSDESGELQCKIMDDVHGQAVKMALVASSTPSDQSQEVQDPIKSIVCQLFLAGKCSHGVNCSDLHQWFTGNSFSYLATLHGHEKPIMGIALPSGSNKLYSGSRDGVLRVWDCETGQCIGVANPGVEIGCMLSEGPWVFIGIPKGVQAWNTKTGLELSLHGPAGQVNVLAMGNELLLAGVEDGYILAWKFDAEVVGFEPAATLTGHKQAVVSFIVGDMRLYSGSVDHTIRVWNLRSLECIHTLVDHTSTVTSLICWTDYLLSCSLDRTIKVWACTENGEIVVIHTHNEEHGVLALNGIHDEEAKPLLICSYDDNSICIYELPLFCERGKIFSAKEFRTIQVVPEVGLFFTGDKSGEIKVWKLSHQMLE